GATGGGTRGRASCSSTCSARGRSRPARRSPRGSASTRSTRSRCCTRSAPDPGRGPRPRAPAGTTPPVEEQRQRPPHPKRTREVVRLAIELGAVAVLAIVLLAFVGVVLYKGGRRADPPPDALVVSQTQDFASLDPALAQTPEAWQLEYATCAKLLNYPAVDGYRGTRLVPEVAASLPAVSSDRRTYTFRLRPGWRFSDGSPVTPRSFTRAFERARSEELVSPAAPYLREVSSWRGRGRTLTIRLRSPAPDFTQRLALPYFCAVPSSAPDRQTHPPP